MGERVVVVGADAAGMSAASQAKRLRGDDLEVVALERGHHTSYSACGIPYWVGGEVDSIDQLVSRTAEQHRANGIDLRMRSEATALDMERREVEVRDRDGGSTYRLGFDHLVLATGARPRRPDVPGADADGIHGVQTLDDGERLLDELAGSPRRAVVVGGGYIGIEMAEAMVNRGLAVTVLTRSAEPMATLDPDMGRLVHEAMEGLGIDVRTSVDFARLRDRRRRSRPCGVHRRGDVRLPTSSCSAPASARRRRWRARRGSPLGRWGGLVTDLQMRVFDSRRRVGRRRLRRVDLDRISGNRVHVALGTHANKQGRVLGTNLGGGYATFPGVVGTAVSKVCDLEIARTGLQGGRLRGRRLPLAHGDRRVDHPRRLLPGRRSRSR